MIATTRSPFLDLGFHQTPPRIISEIKKPTPVCPKDHFRPKISGELLCWLPTENQWRARRVSVRSGQLQVGGGHGFGSVLSLRELNLHAGPNVHSFSLKRSQNGPPVLTLQASNQIEFDRWVKTIAIELIRQTPLEAIKYLDILTLTPQLHSTPKHEAETEKDCNDNSIIPTPIIPPAIINQDVTINNFRPKCLDFNNLDENRNYCNGVSPNNNLEQEERINIAQSLPTIINPSEPFLSLNIPPVRPPRHNDKKPDLLPPADDEQTVEILLKKCQNADSYVPVREKLKLFESLCRLGRIQNDDSTAANNSKYGTKRARSLHDLSNSQAQTVAGVKQICKYFETKNDENKDKDSGKFNTIARGNKTSFGPVKTMISRKYSVQSKNL